MDKAEQPTITQAAYTVADYELAEQCVSAANVVTCDGHYEVDIEKVAETLARHRTTSLAAQDDVTLVEELRAEISNLEAALTQIAGSHWERYGIDQTDIEDVPDLSAEEAMNVARDALSNTPAPSPPAQDGLVEALDDSTIDEIILNFAGGVVQVPSEHNPRGYVSYYRPREAMRKALSAIKEQHHD